MIKIDQSLSPHITDCTGGVDFDGLIARDFDSPNVADLARWSRAELGLPADFADAIAREIARAFGEPRHENQ